MTISPLDFLKLVIGKWEGGYEAYTDDAGNWVTLPGGARRDVGTMRGVTPTALAAYRGIAPATLTPADMQAVTLDEAAAIGLASYYHAPRFDLLAWGPAAAALLDFGWGAGPGQAALSLQRLIGVRPDGAVGPETAAAYAAWVTRLGPQGSTQAIHDMRASFYEHIASIVPGDRQFLQGWLNRDNWASAANPGFFQQFQSA
ncbi:MAG TPA: glycosyl hydrolase 108 family protein [Reyranella sp.]|nr:glycosyl hydrolase 108 family protein [Reyranella sp.]